MELITVLDPEQARREGEEQARREAEEPRRVPAATSSARHRWAEEQAEGQVLTSPTVADTTARSGQPTGEAPADQYTQTGTPTEKQRRDLGRLAAHQLTPVTSAVLVIIALVVVLVVIITRSAGNPENHTSGPLAGTDGTSRSGSPTPAGFTEFRSEQAGFEMAYPSSWSKLSPTDPQVLLLMSQQGTQDSLLVRVGELQEPVGPQQLPAARQMTDKIVTSNKSVSMVTDPKQIELGGLPGFFYSYNFKDATTGQEGAHSHFFLFNGKSMISIVFQALPKERFAEAAKTFDQIAASFHALKK
jgi:hypothetical protein